MTTQAHYKTTLDAGRAGAIADTTAKTLLSRVAVTANIGFGLPVVQGDSDKAARLIATGDAKVLGISVRERSTVHDTFEPGDNMRVITKGAIFVVASVDVSAGDSVTVVAATAAFSNTGGVAIDGATYETSAAAGELAIVRLA